MREIIIIGGGASGLMAAVCAARAGAKVTILEKMAKPGRKLVLTGNGKCNLTNLNEDPNCYHSSDASGVSKYLKQFTVAETLAFFKDLGLLCRDRGGYVYPYAEQATAVLELLWAELMRLNVKVKCQETVTGLEQTKDGTWLVHTATWKYPGDAVILCTGSKAAPNTGSSGDGYTLAAEVGHRIIPVLPALVPLKVKEEIVRSFSGVRSRSRISLAIDDVIVGSEIGELQWTDYGVSGIVVFQISSLAAQALAKEQVVRLHIDLIPDYSVEEILEIATEKTTLAGVLHKKILAVLTKKFAGDIVAQVKAAKDMTVTVTGTRSFEMAQVCSGGVPLTEVKTSLESNVCRGLYLAGELLDVDGLCGGYNLQWAWTTGYIAGTCAAGAENGEKI